MADVEAEIIGESALRQTENGWEKDHSYRVRNLQASTLDELEYFALQEVPDEGTPHPTLPIDGLVVRGREATALSDDLVDVTVQYRTETQNTSPRLGDDTRIEIGGRVTRTETNVDRNGQKLTIGFSGDSNHPKIPESVATVQLPVPQFTLRLTRRETDSPDGRAATYVGKVNSVAWNGQAAEQWLCEAILGRSDDGGQTYVTTYEFGYQEGDSGNGWAAHVFVRNPETGEIPKGVSLNDGEKFFNVIKAADFNNLALI